jgi:toxin ParE1/3/4
MAAPKKHLSVLRVSGPAQRDAADILAWSSRNFGAAAALRYEALLAQALKDIRNDPFRLGTKERPELKVKGVRTYHLFFSRDHVPGERVKEPRHFLLYRIGKDGAIEIGRILHNSRDLERHLPAEYDREI